LGRQAAAQALDGADKGMAIAAVLVSVLALGYSFYVSTL